MIIYIHGFGSSGEGQKAKQFRDYYRSVGEPFVAPSLSYVPELAIKTLEEMIEHCGEKVSLIGSSLGGYYATYLAERAEVEKVVLINPSVYPLKTLTRVLGDAPNFYDGSTFSWQESHLEMLKRYERQIDAYRHKFLVLLQRGDEVLDYREAVAKYEGCKVIVEDGGNHSFEGIGRYFEQIRNFFGSSNPT